MTARRAICVRCATPAADPYAPCAPCREAGVASNHRRVDAPSAGAPAPCARLRALRTLPRTWMQDERGGPTWSYKDRLAAAAVDDAAAVGAPVVVVSSSGNHGAAIAGAASARGIASVVLTTAAIAPAMRRTIAGCGGRLVALPRSEDRWAVMREAVSALGWYPASNFWDPPIGSNPFAVPGYGAIAHEIAVGLGGAPDWVVVPVGYGDGLAGIARGFADLAAAGRIDRVPRMLAAVTSASLPEALAAGRDQPLPAPVVAPSALSIACPQSTFQALDAVRSSAGAARVVDDAAALAARAALGRDEGVFAELSSAVACAALAQARTDGTVGERETAVVVMTSSGLKDQRLPGDPADDLDVVAPELERVLAATALG
jgi:threonine synthase